MRGVIFLLLLAVLQASFGSNCGIHKFPHSDGKYLMKQPCNEHIHPPLRYCKANSVHLGGAPPVESVRYVSVEPEHKCFVPQFSPHCNQQVIARNVPQTTLVEAPVIPQGCRNVVSIEPSGSIPCGSSVCHGPTCFSPNFQPNPDYEHLCVKHVLVNKVRPVYDECIQTVPVVKQIVRHEPVTTVENVPVIERRISCCTKPVCCHKCCEPECVSVPCPRHEFEQQCVPDGCYEPKLLQSPYTDLCEPRCPPPPCNPMPPRYPPRNPCKLRHPPPPCNPMPPRYPSRGPCGPRCPPPPCRPMPPRYPPCDPCKPRCSPPPCEPMPPRYPPRDPCDLNCPLSPYEPMPGYPHRDNCEPRYLPNPCVCKPKYPPRGPCRPRYIPPPPPSPCPYEDEPFPPLYKPRHLKPYRPIHFPPRSRRPKFPLPVRCPRPDLIEYCDTPNYRTISYPQRCHPKVCDKVIHIPIKRRGYRSIVEKKVVPMSLKRKIKKNLVETTIRKTYAPCDCC